MSVAAMDLWDLASTGADLTYFFVRDYWRALLLLTALGLIALGWAAH